MRVHGQAEYEYEPYRTATYSGEYHPLRQVPVEIVGLNESGANETLATTRTDSGGTFEACVPATNGSGNPYDVFVRFTGENPAGSVRNEVHVRDGKVYTAVSGVTTLNASAEAVELGTDHSYDGEREVVPKSKNTAFHVLDRTLEARQFLQDNTDDHWTRKEIRLIFPKGDTSYNANPPIDADEAIWVKDEAYYRSRGTIYHEYGHAVHVAALNYNNEVLPRKGRDIGPGCHGFRTESNLAFALREGFAEYFSAVGTDDWDDEETYYNVAWGGCEPYDADGTMDGYRVEGSVAAVLWDVTDGGPTDDDGLNESFDTVMDLFRDHNPQSMWEVYEYLQDDVDNQTALDEIFTTHGIDVVAPDVTVEGGATQAAYGDEATIAGATTDEHSNVSAVAVRVGEGDWQTVATDDVSSWEATVPIGHEPLEVTVRATDPWSNNATANVTLDPDGGPPIVGSSEGPVRDPDADGRYEDVDGDGDLDIFDALTYYNERRSYEIQANPDLFDFDDDGDVGTLFDAVVLYDSVAI